MSLDTRYRPSTYADVLGQRETIQILKQYVSTGAGFHQSYLFAGPWGSGKCVTGDTLVPTDKGLVPIRSLMGGPGEVEPKIVGVLQEGGQLAQSAYSYRGGVRATIRVQTRFGYALEGTPNHRIRVMTKSGAIEWRTLGDIRVGDHACIARHGLFGVGADLSGFQFCRNPHDWCSTGFPPPTEMTPDLARLMGYLIGDGTCTYRGGVTVTCADDDIKADVKRILGLFLTPVRDTPDRRTHNCSGIRGSGVQFRSFLAHAGVGYVRAGQKEVPWSIMASPKHIVAEFLKGYFETDGTVIRGGVEISTKSERLARQVQVLLLQFGVVSKLSSRVVGRYGTHWRLSTKAISLESFVRDLGFLSPRKTSALQSIVDGNHCKRTTRWVTNIRDVVPNQKSRIGEFYRSLPPALRTRELGGFFQCCLSSSQTSCTTRQVDRIVRDFPHGTHATHFRALQDANYFYDPVVLATPGEAEVFDLNVPDGEMFSANGFMNHNTTLARVLARALLCTSPVDGEPCDRCTSCKSLLEGGTSPDFCEIDAATNSGKDSVRKIVDEIQYSTFSGKRRIYLLDESHRLSTDALDALLKPLEDNYPGTQDKLLVCIFCTTEPERMRNTILSRCAPAFVVRPVLPAQVGERLATVCDAEGIPYERPALDLIGEITECHVRDALKAVEGVSMLGGVTVSNVSRYLHLDYAETILGILSEVKTDLPAAITRAEGLLKTMSPITMYEKLSDMAMLAYRSTLGPVTVPTYLDRGAIEGVGKTVGGELLDYVEKLSSRPGRPTAAMLLCDLSQLHRGVQRVFMAGAPKYPAPPNSAPTGGNIKPPDDKPSIVDSVYVNPRAINSRVQSSTSTSVSAVSSDYTSLEFFQLVKRRVLELGHQNGSDGQSGRNDLGDLGTHKGR